MSARGHFRPSSAEVAYGLLPLNPKSGHSASARFLYRRYDGSVFLHAFDLIELNGDDLRRGPLEVRKTTLASR